MFHRDPEDEPVQVFTAADIEALVDSSIEPAPAAGGSSRLAVGVGIGVFLVLAVAGGVVALVLAAVVLVYL